MFFSSLQTFAKLLDLTMCMLLRFGALPYFIKHLKFGIYVFESQILFLTLDVLKELAVDFEEACPLNLPPCLKVGMKFNRMLHLLSQNEKFSIKDSLAWFRLAQRRV